MRNPANKQTNKQTNRHTKVIAISRFSRDNESKKKYKKNKTITTILKLFDTIVDFATTSSSTTLSLTGIGLIVIPTSTAPARALLIGNNVIYQIIINKYNKYKKLYEKDRQTVKSFDNSYRKSIQDNIIDKVGYENLFNIFTKYVDENKNDSFFKPEYKKN